jgi:hypothetical protein
MKTFVVSLLSLIAIFFGGCSIMGIGTLIVDCFPSRSADCDTYGTNIAVVAILGLSFAALVGWLAWRAYKKPEPVEDEGGGRGSDADP